MSFGQPLEALELVGVYVDGEPFLGCHCILLQGAADSSLRQALSDVNGQKRSGDSRLDGLGGVFRRAIGAIGAAARLRFAVIYRS